MGICHTQVFSGPREFAAFLGLTPKQTSSGGKERLGRVSKMGKRMTASSQARG
jgi:transposase